MTTLIRVFVVISILVFSVPAVCASFSCGPHAITYEVLPLTPGVTGQGIRCVVTAAGSPELLSFPKFIWYGEGKWNNTSYRHLGHAHYLNNTLKAYASDFHGNGEGTSNNFPGNLTVTIVGDWPAPAEIHISGAWNERWIRRDAPLAYTPLPHPTVCGTAFRGHKAVDMNEARQGSGIRCVMRAWPELHTLPVVWYGAGNWDTQRYTHLGFITPEGYGAMDLCGPSFGIFCNAFAAGSITIKAVNSSFDVLGAWSEKWLQFSGESGDSAKTLNIITRLPAAK